MRRRPGHFFRRTSCALSQAWRVTPSNPLCVDISYTSVPDPIRRIILVQSPHVPQPGVLLERLELPGRLVAVQEPALPIRLSQNSMSRSRSIHLLSAELCCYPGSSSAGSASVISSDEEPWLDSTLDVAGLLGTRPRRLDKGHAVLVMRDLLDRFLYRSAVSTDGNGLPSPSLSMLPFVSPIAE